MPVVERLDARLEVDIDSIDREFAKASREVDKQLARINSRTWIQFRTRLSDLRKELSVVSWQIRQAQRRWDFTIESNLRIDRERITKEITAVNTQFANFQRRWDSAVSGVQKRFNELWQSIGWVARWFWAFLTLGFLSRGIQNIDRLRKEFDLAFVWVQKTIEWTTAQFEDLRAELIQITFDTWETFQNIANLAQTAGQLGVPIEQISNFTRVATDLKVATNLSGEAAVLSLTRLLTVTGESINNIGRLWSAVVGLWNNFATAENEILSFASQTQSTSQFSNLTATDILWLSTAFTAVWIGAEAGWSAVTKWVQTINQAVLDGGQRLEWFARVSWVSAEEFQRLWRDDSAEAFTRFVEWIWDEWDRGVQTLNDLLWTNVRTSKAFISVAGAWDLLRDSIARANDEFEKNNALTEEASKRYETYAIRQQRLNREKEAFRVILAENNTAVGDLSIAFQEFIERALKWGATLLELLSLWFTKAWWNIRIWFLTLLQNFVTDLQNSKIWWLILDTFNIDLTDSTLFKSLDNSIAEIEKWLDQASKNFQTNVSRINEPTKALTGELEKLRAVLPTLNKWSEEYATVLTRINGLNEKLWNPPDTTATTKIISDIDDVDDRETELEKQRQARFAEFRQREEEKRKQREETLENEKKMAEEQIDFEVGLIEDWQDRIDKAIDDSNKQVREYQSDITKLQDDFQELSESATADLQKIDDELEQLATNRATSIADRVINIRDEIAEIEGKLLAWPAVRNANELVDRLDELRDELNVAEGLSSERDISSARTRADRTITEQIVADSTWEREEIEARRQKVQDELAEEEVKLQQELALLQDNIATETQLLEDYSDLQIKLEEQITNRLWVEVSKRRQTLDTYIAQLDIIIAKRRQAGLSVWSIETAGGWQSNTQQAGDNNSTTNNLWDIYISDNTAVESLERTLNTQIT